MSYDEFMEIILNSNEEDWLYDDSRGLFVLKTNLLITIISHEIKYTDEEAFYEDWVENFPKKEAWRAEFEICYAGTCIEELCTAMVDGARMYIPFPDIVTKKISDKKYKLGKIVNKMNQSYGYDSYLARAGITVAED